MENDLIERCIGDINFDTERDFKGHVTGILKDIARLQSEIARCTKAILEKRAELKSMTLTLADKKTLLGE